MHAGWLRARLPAGASSTRCDFVRNILTLLYNTICGYRTIQLLYIYVYIYIYITIFMISYYTIAYHIMLYYSISHYITSHYSIVVYTSRFVRVILAQGPC